MRARGSAKGWGAGATDASNSWSEPKTSRLAMSDCVSRKSASVTAIPSAKGDLAMDSPRVASGAFVKCDMLEATTVLLAGAASGASILAFSRGRIARVTAGAEGAGTFAAAVGSAPRTGTVRPGDEGPPA